MLMPALPSCPSPRGTSTSIPASSSSIFAPSASPSSGNAQSHDGVAGPASPESASEVVVTDGEATKDGVCACCCPTAAELAVADEVVAPAPEYV